MVKEPTFIARYTIHIDVKNSTEQKATQFPIQFMQTIHHIFPGVEVHVIREPDEDIPW